MQQYVFSNLQDPTGQPIVLEVEEHEINIINNATQYAKLAVQNFLTIFKEN